MPFAGIQNSANHMRRSHILWQTLYLLKNLLTSHTNWSILCKYEDELLIHMQWLYIHHGLLCLPSLINHQSSSPLFPISSAISINGKFPRFREYPISIGPHCIGSSVLWIALCCQCLLQGSLEALWSNFLWCPQLPHSTKLVETAIVEA